MPYGKKKPMMRKSAPVRRAGGAGFKPCRGCPRPSVCKSKGKCIKKAMMRR